MSYRLKTYDSNPPGGYCYNQDFDPKRKNFGCAPDITALAGIVARWRAANGLPRSSVREALEDVDRYNCARLGNDPRYCFSSDVPLGAPGSTALNTSSPIIAPCGGCGAPV